MMRLLIAFLICLSSTYYSQVGNSCTSPLPFCAPSTIFSTAVGSTSGAGPDYGCLTTQPSPTWLYTQVTMPGNMVLQFTGASDVDVICWGPFNNMNFCTQLTAANTIGCSTSPASTETISIGGALTGQYYVFMVTNPSNAPQAVTMSQVSGTAAACNNATCTQLLTPGICFVTPNTSLHHQVYFNEDPSPVLKHTVVYREGVNTNQWDSIGTVPAGQPGFFVDNNVNCNQQSYRYVIRNRDTCGNLTAYSNPHQTIHLQSNIGTNNEVNLTWNYYTGINFTTQYIFRGSNPASMSLYGQVAGNVNSYTDLTPLSGNSYYRIGLDVPGGCNSTAPYGDTLIYSNMRPNTVTGIEYLDNGEFLGIYPNPASSEIHVRSFEAAYTVELMDLLGKTIQESKVSGNSATFDVSLLNRGLYIVSVTNSKGRYYRKILLQ